MVSRRTGAAVVALGLLALVASSIASASSLLSPFPIVQVTGKVAKGGTKLRRLTVVAPTGSTVTAHCRGRGCPFRSKTYGGGTIRVRKLEGRRLRAGVVIELSITSPDAIGKYTRLKVRRGRPPARADACLLPGESKAVACPSSSPGSTFDISDGSVTAAKLADGAVTATKLAADSVNSSALGANSVGTDEIAADAVASSEILDGTVTTADISQSVWSSAHMVGTLAARPPADPGNNGFLYLATDDNLGTLYRSDGTNWVKAAAGVSEASIPDGSITTAKLADSAVTSAKIATGAVTSALILDATVASADIAADTITAADIASGGVGSAEIADGAITSADLSSTGGSEAVATGNIRDLNVTTAKIADLAVTAGKLAAGAVTNAKLGTDSVLTGNITDGTIQAVDIADGAVNSNKIADSSVTTTDIAADTIAAGDIAAGAVTTSEILDGTVATADIAPGASTEGTYRPVVERSGKMNSNVADTWVLPLGGDVTLNDATDVTASADMFHFDPADYAITGRQTKLRLTAVLLTNSTAPGSNFNVGLYPVTGSAGGNDKTRVTLGGVVSQVSISAPSASTRNFVAGSDFTAPSSGFYVLAVNTSGNVANNAQVNIEADLQVRNTP